MNIAKNIPADTTFVSTNIANHKNKSHNKIIDNNDEIR